VTSLREGDRDATRAACQLEARFVALELGNGTLGGKQLVSERQILARRVPQVKITDEWSYGLAWGITKESGLDAVGHNGGTYGFSSLLEMLPEHGVGIVVLANSGNAGTFNGAVHRRFIELLFDGKAEAHDALATQLELDAKGRTDRRPRAGTTRTRWPHRPGLERRAARVCVRAREVSPDGFRRFAGRRRCQLAE
jgi:CubicO group peptidase (beta-lactamase class C family)